MIVNINGQFVAPESANVPVSDGGFLYGDTLFETIAIKSGQFRFLPAHLARLKQSAHQSKFPFPEERITEALEAVRNKLGATNARVRLTLSRGEYDGPTRPAPEQVRFIITARKLISDFSTERQAGIDCVAAPNRRVNALAPLPQMKRGNYQDCLHALHHARISGAFEALFIDPDGYLLEGATSNLFIVREGTLITPPLGELILAGVMRSQILRAAEDLNISWHEDTITVADLQSAQEAFISNSLIELLPIASWEGQPLSRGTLHLNLLKRITEYS